MSSFKEHLVLLQTRVDRRGEAFRPLDEETRDLERVGGVRVQVKASTCEQSLKDE